ncbi:MAG TPA: esterase, partial [Ottowia sp.]|nr:esterase [Ottowia sp.]
MTLFRLSCIAASAALVVACGGSGDSGPKRGDLIDPAATLVTLTAAQIDGATAANGLQTLTG